VPRCGPDALLRTPSITYPARDANPPWRPAFSCPPVRTAGFWRALFSDSVSFPLEEAAKAPKGPSVFLRSWGSAAVRGRYFG